MALFCSPVLAQEGESCFFGLSTFTRHNSGLINTAGEWWSDRMCLRNAREQITKQIQSETSYIFHDCGHAPTQTCSESALTQMCGES